MSNQKKQMPPQVPALEKKAVMHEKELFYRLYAACLSGLVQRSDLEWHHEHLARRARLYAEAALKEIVDT